MRLPAFLALLLLVVASGCGGPKLVSVTGKVLQKGTGLTAGAIYLHPAAGNSWAGDRPTSVLQTDGTFTLQTPPHGTGAPPGSWKVTLSPALAGRVRRPELGDVNKTPWTLDVPPEGVKDKTFEVK